MFPRTRTFALVILAGVLLAALAASVWFWLKLGARQPKEPAQEPQEIAALCKDFGEQEEGMTCENAAKAALQKAEGKLYQIRKVDAFGVGEAAPRPAWRVIVQSNETPTKGTQIFFDRETGQELHSSPRFLPQTPAPSL